MRRMFIAGAYLAALVGCHGPGGTVQGLTVKIAVTPSALAFGSVYLQANATQSLTVQNQGTAQETLTVTLAGGDFKATGGPTFASPPGATTAIPITFSPTQAAVEQGTAHVAWDEGSVDVQLNGTGLAWPDCTPTAQCEASVFDPTAGVCKTAQLADGAGCDGGSSCLQDARCQAGQCVGEPLVCNDDNACTVDTCVEGQGCVSQDESGKCTGTDPCQIYSCDPQKGCTSSNAPDGTLCSNHESCQTADICILGKCIGTPVPDGFPCALWWAPCVTDAECRAGTCDSPTADAEKPGDIRWTWQPDGGPTAIDVPAVDELGNSYVCAAANTGGWTSGQANLVSLDQCGNERWQNADFPGVTSLLLAGEELVFVDPNTNDVTAIYRDSGQLLWQLNLVPAVSGVNPDAGGTAACYQIQINDLAVSPQGPIYAAGDVTNLCESGDSFPQPFLAGILPNGSLAWSRVLDTAYAQPFGQGLVVDGQGNSYVSVTISSNEGEPVTQSAIVSFDSQGTERFLQAVAPGLSGSLALGTDRLFEVSTLQVLNLDGGLLETLDAGEYPGSLASAVVDGQNDLFVFSSSGYFGASVTGYTPAGSDPLWKTGGGDDASNIALGEGQLFFATNEFCSCPAHPTPPQYGPQSLTAVDSTTGTTLWTAPPALGPYAFPAGTLTLTNTATLVLPYGGRVNAFFAGEQRPPPDAPWSRAGGSYWNQSSSAPPAQPSFP